jgi:hypothetical protein
MRRAWCFLLGILSFVVFSLDNGLVYGQKLSKEMQKMMNQPPRNYAMAESCATGKGTLWRERRSTDEEFTNIRRAAFEVPGATLGYFKGKLVMLQYEVPAGRFLIKNEKHTITWIHLAKEGPVFDHVDLVYSQATVDYKEPHYEVRFYLVDHSEHESYCRSQGQANQGHEKLQQGNEKPQEGDEPPKGERSPGKKPLGEAPGQKSQ